MNQPKVIAVIRPSDELADIELRLVPQESVAITNNAIDFERTPYTAVQETRAASGEPILVITIHQV